MKPNDKFYFIKNYFVNLNIGDLIRCYLPIIGMGSSSVYQFLVAIWDNGSKPHQFSEILNHLNFGFNTLQDSFDLLSAMQLIEIYEQKDSQNQQIFGIVLYPPLSTQDFLKHNVYRTLLEKKIGETCVSNFEKVNLIHEKKISKNFSDVFDDSGENFITNRPKNDFEIEHFEQLMARDLLRFENKDDSIIALYNISEKYKKSWFDVYQVAKETAVDDVISIKRIKNFFKSRTQNSSKVIFSDSEKSLISVAKSKTPIDVLAEFKESKYSGITGSEKEVLKYAKNLGLLDEVINVALFDYFNRYTDTSNLKANLFKALVNDYSYRGLNQAEDAVEFLSKEIKSQKQGGFKGNNKTHKSNVPDWSQPDYKNETSAEKQAELEEQKRRLLAKLEGGGE